MSNANDVESCAVLRGGLRTVSEEGYTRTMDAQHVVSADAGACECAQHRYPVSFADCETFTPTRIAGMQRVMYVHVITVHGQTRVITAERRFGHGDGAGIILRDWESYGHAVAMQGSVLIGESANESF